MANVCVCVCVCPLCASVTPASSPDRDFNSHIMEQNVSTSVMWIYVAKRYIGISYIETIYVIKRYIGISYTETTCHDMTRDTLEVHTLKDKPRT